MMLGAVVAFLAACVLTLVGHYFEKFAMRRTGVKPH
jgi:hypothetical protein